MTTAGGRQLLFSYQRGPTAADNWATKKFEPEFAGAFKALPVVQHKGASINETGACCRYIADVLGYMPSDAMERAQVGMVADHIYEDILINVAYCIWNFRDWDESCLGGFAGPGSGVPLKFSEQLSFAPPPLVCLLRCDACVDLT